VRGKDPWLIIAACAREGCRNASVDEISDALADLIIQSAVADENAEWEKSVLKVLFTDAQGLN